MNLPQDTLVKFSMGDVSGEGRVCGISNTGIPGFGVGYILQITKMRDRDNKPIEYEYTHMTAFDSQIVSASFEGKPVADREFSCTLDRPKPR